MLFVVVLALIILETGCSASVTNGTSETTRQIDSFTETQAIAKANLALGGIFPSKPGTVERNVWEGGPAPGRAIPATLQTEVQRDGKGSYLVTLSEQWSAKDFNGNNSSNNKTTREYHWTFKVTTSGSTLVSEGGDFPPQDVK